MKKALLPLCFACFLIFPAVDYAQVSQAWVRKFVGSGNDNAAGIAADNAGNVYIAGNNNWGYSTADIYTIRYNSAGTQTSGILYNGPYNNADEARAIVTDGAGNVYVAGRTSVNSSTSDIVLIKYNSSAIQQWVTIYNTPQNYIDDVTAMAVDASGNIYLTGNIVKGAFEYDYLTLKFNSSGIFLWAATYNGTANGVDMASDIAVDASGNVFVTGLSAGQIIRRFATISTGYDYVTIKYNSSGTQLWVQRYSGSNSNDEAKSLALDGSGSVYITGASPSSTGGLDCVTIKYGNDGVFHWLQRYNGPAASNDAGNSLAVDGSANVFVTGYSTNGSGRTDVLTLKYNSAGAQLWLNVYDAGSGTQDIGKVLSLDPSGNAYVAAETSVPGVVNSDFLTIKYTASGVQSWAARYNGPENQTDYPTAMAVVMPQTFPGGSSNAVIYVTGYSYGDVVTIKYTQPLVIGGASPEPTMNLAEELITGDFKLNHYPNPASSYTNIQYNLPADGRVTIDVYDALGRKAFTLVNGLHKAGHHTKRLNTSTLTNGLYYYQCTVHSGGNEIRQTKAIVIQ